MNIDGHAAVVAAGASGRDAARALAAAGGALRLTHGQGL